MLTIRTERLLLRPLCPDEAAAMAAYRSDPEVARYVPWTAPYPLAKAEELIGQMQGRTGLLPGEWLLLAVERKQDATLIGDCAVRLSDDARQATIGYVLARPHHGQGFATEAVRALLGELFTVQGLHRVTAECGTDNLASWRLLERVGMRREAHLVESIFFKGAWASDYHYGILASEWRG